MGAELGAKIVKSCGHKEWPIALRGDSTSGCRVEALIRIYERRMVPVGAS